MATIHLGPFRLDPQNELLFRGTEPAALGRRAAALLRELVRQPGQLVSKDALIEAAWPGQSVEESNLTVQIAALRRVLGEAPGGAGWIETMPRRGYRFVGPVVTGEENSVAAAVALAQVVAPLDVAAIEHGEAEHRQITVMSCEATGAAARADGIGLEALLEAIGAFQHCVSEIVGRHSGFIASRLGNTVLVLFGYPAAHEHDAEQAIHAGLELCAVVRNLRADADVPMRCRVGIATRMVIVGDLVGIGELPGHGIVGDAPDLAVQLRVSAQYVGRFALSRSHLEEALALHDPIFHRSLGNQFGSDAYVNSQAYLGFVLFCLGYPDQALAQIDAAIAEARTLGLRPSLALTLTFGARLHSLGGENAALDERAAQLIAVATEQGFPFWRAMGAIYRGWVKVKNGNVTEGISLLRSGSTAYRATGAELYMPHFLALLAGACEIAGQIGETATLVDEALRIVERTGERWFAAELYRHKGRLLVRHGHAQAAEELYCEALKIAREQEAKLWELRGAMSLARLWGGQGRREEAQALLAPVYGWFTEGFATPDLKEARALLDELA